MPVFTPTRHVSSRPSRDQRLQLADAVAEVFHRTLPDVISARDTDRRLAALTPAALACDLPGCVGAVAMPLHARAVTLVREDYTSAGSLRVVIDTVTPDGVVTAHAEGDQPVGAWPEALALARIVAARAVALVSANSPVAPPAEAPRIPVIPPVRAPAPVVQAPETPSLRPPSNVLRDLPAHATHRRGWEIALGSGLIAAGLAATTVGLVAVAQDGSVVSTSAAMETDYRAGTRDYVLLGLGIPALVGGVLVLMDGLRARPTEDPPAGASMGLGATVVAHGGAMTLSGAF